MACLTNGVFRPGSRSGGMTGELVDPRPIPDLLAPAIGSAAEAVGRTRFGWNPAPLIWFPGEPSALRPVVQGDGRGETHDD